ncbi:hypothetical protein GOBAR_DD25179 [Gossypium barbadense]|nr:hypothetical protein GOBAR_DD25179 [Gossypium barbadense]
MMPSEQAMIIEAYMLSVAIVALFKLFPRTGFTYRLRNLKRFVRIIVSGVATIRVATPLSQMRVGCAPSPTAHMPCVIQRKASWVIRVMDDEPLVESG